MKKLILGIVVILVIFMGLYLKVDQVNREESTFKTMIGLFQINVTPKGYIEIDDHTYMVRKKKIDDFLEYYGEINHLTLDDQIGSGYIFVNNGQRVTVSSYQLTRYHLIFND